MVTTPGLASTGLGGGGKFPSPVDDVTSTTLFCLFNSLINMFIY